MPSFVPRRILPSAGSSGAGPLKMRNVWFKLLNELHFIHILLHFGISLLLLLPFFRRAVIVEIRCLRKCGCLKKKKKEVNFLSG